MFIDYWNYTNCIRCENYELIEQALTQILEQEGCRRICKPLQPMSDQQLYQNCWHWRLWRELWVIGLFVGAPGWTIVKTEPNELLCRRAQGTTHPRLSELARIISCDVFHWGVYDNSYAILLEADAAGRIFISGEHRLEEKNQFYDEQINHQGYSKFSLLDIPEEIKKLMKPPYPEEEEKRKKRLEELDRLQEEETKRLEKLQMLTKEERKIRLEELRMLEEEEKHSIDIQSEIAELLEGNAEKIDKALGTLLSGSPSYWYLNQNLFYLAYTQQQQLEANEARLLYFQPAEHYRQLDPLYEIGARY